MKKRGNISLLVMFVLVACSLLGLLTVHFIKSMSTQYSQITSYYKSYYLAKAGVETALTQLQTRGLGFSESIGSSHTVVSDNIHQVQSSFSFSVLGRSSFLSKSLLDTGSCTQPFVLFSGESLVLPLFMDSFTGSLLSSFTSPIVTTNLGVDLSQLSPMYYKDTSPGPVNMGLLLSDGQGLYPNGIYFSSISSPWAKDVFKQFSTKASTIFNGLEDSNLLNWPTDKRFTPYLVIANKDRLPVSFCLGLPKDTQLPSQQYFVQSFGNYASTQVVLEATYKQPMPSFLLDSELGMSDSN